MLLKEYFDINICKNISHLLGSKLLVHKKTEALSQSLANKQVQDSVRCTLSYVTAAMFECRVVHFSR